MFLRTFHRALALIRQFSCSSGQGTPAASGEIGAVAACGLLIAASLLPVHAQGQQSKRQPGWPCSGTIDPAYVKVAEGTGGKVLLFQPGELSGAAADVSASDRHPETVFRAGGELSEGVHEFDVPVDSTMESAYFSMSMQCLRGVGVIRPSGDEVVAGEEGVEEHRFQAIRLLTIAKPTPGIWKVRLSGRGFFSLIVAATTELSLRGVTFMDGDVPLTRGPVHGRSQRLQARSSGAAGEIGFQFLSWGAATIQAFDLTLEKESDRDRTYAGDVTTPVDAFRVAITGLDANGFRFQRVQDRLFFPHP